MGKAGCEDALVGIGHPDRLALEFCRESDNADEAVGHAIVDVSLALPSASLIDVVPFLR